MKILSRFFRISLLSWRNLYCIAKWNAGGTTILASSSTGTNQQRFNSASSHHCISIETQMYSTDFNSGENLSFPLPICKLTWRWILTGYFTGIIGYVRTHSVSHPLVSRGNRIFKATTEILHRETIPLQISHSELRRY